MGKMSRILREDLGLRDEQLSLGAVRLPSAQYLTPDTSTGHRAAQRLACAAEFGDATLCGCADDLFRPLSRVINEHALPSTTIRAPTTLQEFHDIA